MNKIGKWVLTAGWFLIISSFTPLVFAENDPASCAIRTPMKYADKKTEALVRRILDKYQKCGSFSAEGVSYGRWDTDAATSVTATGKIWFKRPDLIRMDWTSDRSESYYTKDGKNYSYYSATNTYSEQVEFYRCLWGGPVRPLSFLLARVKDPISMGIGYQEIKVEKNIDLDGVPCFELILREGEIGFTKMYVRRSDLALVKLIRNIKKTPEEKKRSSELMTKMLKDQFFKDFNLSSFNVTSKSVEEEIYLFKNIQWEPKLEKKDLEYPVPGNAKRVKSK